MVFGAASWASFSSGLQVAATLNIILLPIVARFIISRSQLSLLPSSRSSCWIRRWWLSRVFPCFGLSLYDATDASFAPVYDGSLLVLITCQVQGSVWG